MKRAGEKGVTLVELLLGLALFALIAVAATSLLTGTTRAQNYGDEKAGLYREALLIMEKITADVRLTTYLFVPNAHAPVRNVLSYSCMINQDNDYYFGDPLFPRIDEDPGEDLTGEGTPGVPGVDDDGDGTIDEADNKDDDEDSSHGEDPLDGVDNDGDGDVDEDPTSDINGDGAPGIAGMDDDGDGSVDEGNKDDDDEDGLIDEDPADPVIYTIVSGTSTFQVYNTKTAQTAVLSTRASLFRVTREAPERLRIELGLNGRNGESVTITEVVCPRNVYQRTGRRVR